MPGSRSSPNAWNIGRFHRSTPHHVLHFIVQINYLKSYTEVHPGLHKVLAVLTVRFVEEDEGVFAGGKYDLFHGRGDNIQHQLSPVIRSRLSPQISAEYYTFVGLKRPKMQIFLSFWGGHETHIV